MNIILDNNYYVSIDQKIIGYKGETDARKISFEGLAVDGADSYKLRIYYDDIEQAYDVPIENGQIIVNGSLLRKRGYVQAQVIACKTDGDKFSMVKKSNVFSLEIGSSLIDGSAIPSYEQSVEALEKVLAVDLNAEKVEKINNDIRTIAENVNAVQNKLQTAETDINTINENALNHLTCAIFRKVCCIGDSATSGHITGTDKKVYGSNPEFSWVSYLSRLTGNEYINLGINGASTKIWLTSADGLAKAKLPENKAQAYLVGLGMNEGLNDSWEIGTAEDIGSSTAETYYRYMSELVREISAINPKAHIFLQTIPRTEERFTAINTAIKTIAETYKGTYNVHVLDLSNYKELYSIKSITDDYVASHWTAIGYQQFAQILALIWSDYINANVKKFQDVFLIPYKLEALGIKTIDKPTSAKDYDVDIDTKAAGDYLQMLLSYSGNKFLITYPIGNLATGKSYTYKAPYAKDDTTVGVISYTFSVTKTADKITITATSLKADGVEAVLTPPSYIMTYGK